MKEILVYTIGPGRKGWYDIKLVKENDEFVDVKKFHYGTRKWKPLDAMIEAKEFTDALAKRYGGIKITWI